MGRSAIRWTWLIILKAAYYLSDRQTTRWAARAASLGFTIEDIETRH